MKRITGIGRYFSMPVFIICCLITALFSYVIYGQMEEGGREMLTKSARMRLDRMGEAIDRYFAVSEAFRQKIEKSEGKEYPGKDEAKALISTGVSIRSIQLVPEEGKPVYYADRGGIFLFGEMADNPLKDAMDDARFKHRFNLKTGVKISENEMGMVGILPVYFHEASNEQTLWGYVLLVADSDSFLKALDFTDLAGESILCGLTQQNGSITKEVFRNGDYSHDPVRVSRDIYGDLWTLYLRPEVPWVNPWVMILIGWAGLLTAFVTASLVRRISNLHEEGNRDKLTGVYNRNGGDQAFFNWYEGNMDGKGFVMAVDIDNFKLINDVYGHRAGDEALRVFVKDMRRIFGPDAIITRNGGDEFIIFAPDQGENLLELAMAEFTEQPHIFEFEGKTIRFTASLGCARYPQQDTDYSRLCSKADLPLYNAKLNGKGRWAFFAPEEMKAKDRTQLGFNLSDVATHMPGAMVVVRPTEKEEILFANQVMADMMECRDYEDFMAESDGCLMNIIHPEDVSGVLSELARQLADEGNTKKTEYISYRLLTSGGKSIRVEATARLVDNPYYGKLLYVFILDHEDREMRLGKR